MANKRMFSLSITDSDAFLSLPLTAQALYFHLGMRADDRGYVDKPVAILKMVSATNGDMENLISKKFVLFRANGLVLIKHWNLNNTLRKDRLKETTYKEDLTTLYLDENNSYTEKETPIRAIEMKGENNDEE